MPSHKSLPYRPCAGMGVTMLTQFATAMLNSRGRHLKRGIMVSR